ncbi:MAG: LPS export ABC transporter ATP-binding protein [Candidatus Endonucleobacter bathymodioli]|uniref:Lipopolysaccharide export system ATP-binding protein LptB n=1 Tax=Candidatus Endonucleibacter bathymodioli TaxID=539814 RepID=A0AA90SSJ5_9GAMM|nr:LPS export ABC transporter ATP-binding protein [Candidatus Endonucleobacter bathymodioli]
MATLIAENLCKIYKKRQVVRNVSLQVNSGEIVGLLGPNGAGKTTCFYMVVGLIKADGGTVKINNNDLTFTPMHGRAHAGIGYLPQEASIFRRMTVKNNILAILETRSDLSKKERKSKAEALMEEFNITHIRNSAGMSLSGGERRRVEIARALAIDLRFILLDEPFAGVDPISVGDIKVIIRQLQSRGIGVLITDHNVRETLDICEKAYIVSEGRIIAKGDTQVVLNDQNVRDVYLGQRFSL